MQLHTLHHIRGGAAAINAVHVCVLLCVYARTYLLSYVRSIGVKRWKLEVCGGSLYYILCVFVCECVNGKNGVPLLGLCHIFFLYEFIFDHQELVCDSEKQNVT